ncbi:MAG: C40 family peptidase [Pseudomonadota bacterium]
MARPTRSLTALALLVATLATAQMAPAEETGQTGGIGAGMTEKAKPLLKALGMLGTPYKFGGSNPDQGVDCSGFVRHVYKESAGVSLPRSARDMSKEGEQVAREALKPGDLVFFNTRKQPNSHVGIYKGDGEFIHASSSRTKEVTISRMDQKYWAARFNGARRVLPTE